MVGETSAKTLEAVFKASVHSFRTVPSRKVVQIVLEVPIEQQELIARIAQHNSWVAVARITAPAQKRSCAETGKSTTGLAQRIGRMCNDADFQKFSKTKTAEETAAQVRRWCHVTSRKDIVGDRIAESLWDVLEASFNAWKAGMGHDDISHEFRSTVSAG